MHDVNGHVIRVGDVVHVHDVPEYSVVIDFEFTYDGKFLIGICVRRRPRGTRMVSATYINKAVLGLDGPHCLCCERQAREGST